MSSFYKFMSTPNKNVPFYKKMIFISQSSASMPFISLWAVLYSILKLAGVAFLSNSISISLFISLFGTLTLQLNDLNALFQNLEKCIHWLGILWL